MNYNLLLLEDNAEQLRATKDILSELIKGVEIETAADEDGVISKINDDKKVWDFVVLDVDIQGVRVGDFVFKKIKEKNFGKRISPLVVCYTGNAFISKNTNKKEFYESGSFEVKDGFIIQTSSIQKSNDDYKNFEAYFLKAEKERFEQIKIDLSNTKKVIEAIPRLKNNYKQTLEKKGYASVSERERLLETISNTRIYKEQYTLEHILPIRIKKLTKFQDSIETLEEIEKLFFNSNWGMRLHRLLATNDHYGYDLTHNDNIDEKKWITFLNALNELDDCIPKLNNYASNLKKDVLRELYGDENTPNDSDLTATPPPAIEGWDERKGYFKKSWKDWKQDDSKDDFSNYSIPQKIYNKILKPLYEKGYVPYANKMQSRDIDLCIYRPLIDYFIENFTRESIELLDESGIDNKKFVCIFYESDNFMNILLAHNALIKPGILADLGQYFERRGSSWSNFKDIRGWADWELWIKEEDNKNWKCFVPNTLLPKDFELYSDDIKNQFEECERDFTVVAKLAFEKYKDERN